jgi:hypothetical protein
MIGFSGSLLSIGQLSCPAEDNRQPQSMDAIVAQYTLIEMAMEV